jgi:hypothetical protein
MSPTTPEPADADTESDDQLVWGAEEIGEIINRTRRQVFHLAATGALPVRRVGGRLVALKSKLMAIAG